MRIMDNSIGLRILPEISSDIKRELYLSFTFFLLDTCPLRSALAFPISTKRITNNNHTTLHHHRSTITQLKSRDEDQKYSVQPLKNIKRVLI